MFRYRDEKMNTAETVHEIAEGEKDRAGTVRVALKLIFCLTLSVLAFGKRTTPDLLMLSAVNVLLLAVQSFGLKAIKRGTLFFLSQSAVIMILYLIRFGWTMEASWEGFRISWQLFLAFLPGFIFVETTPQPRIVQVLSYVMSHRTAFVVATCLKFLPLLLTEIRSIYEGQVMRGARIRPRDLMKPWNWTDVIHCLVVPAIIQGMKLAGDIALAARARDFGVSKQRTCWPGD